MFRPFRTLLLLIVFVLSVWPGYALAVEWLEPPDKSEWWEIKPNTSQLVSSKICSSKTHTPVGSCFDWITGPGSSVNSGLVVRYRDASSNLKSAPLYETDQGWPVMSPDGKSMEIMAYGDTYAVNPGYTGTDLQADIKKCVSQSISDPVFQYVVSKLPNKSLACEYAIRSGHTYFTPSQQPTIMLFTKSNNVVFFDAEIDTSLLYHIKFKDHLYQKAVLRNGMENWHNGIYYFVGVYTTDYFYVCPGSAVSCTNSQKVLHFITGTVYWHNQLNVNNLTSQQKYFKLSREGAGIYRFGTLASKADASTGCRHRFSPDTVVSTALPDPSCYATPTAPLQPAHVLYYGPGKTVSRTDNPHVLWGWGTKFANPVVMHGFADIYYKPKTKPGGPSTDDYVYFIGSGEQSSVIDPVSNSALYTPTNKIYIARLIASEDDIVAGKVEYYKGIVKGQSQWGAYDQAQPIVSGMPIYPVSFTKRFGKYYIAASCPGVYGMCVGESKDGYKWAKPQIAAYTDIPLNQDGPAVLVYGHAWVPEALYPHTKAIPYVFSVWKSQDKFYTGYFFDFWFKGGNKYVVPIDKRFPAYNTKMNLYWPTKP